MVLSGSVVVVQERRPESVAAICWPVCSEGNPETPGKPHRHMSRVLAPSVSEILPEVAEVPAGLAVELQEEEAGLSCLSSTRAWANLILLEVVQKAHHPTPNLR